MSGANDGLEGYVWAVAARSCRAIVQEAVGEAIAKKVDQEMTAEAPEQIKGDTTLVSGLAEVRALSLEDLAAQIEKLQSGPYVMSCASFVSAEMRARIEAEWEEKFPGQQLVVLGPGMRLERMPSPGQLDRIEASLATLVKALAEDDEESGPTEDLDGKKHERPTPRPETRGL